MLLPTINLDIHKESPDQVKKNYFQILIHETKSFFQVFFSQRYRLLFGSSFRTHEV